MRAKEFTINIPINIKINDNGEPEVDMDQESEHEEEKDLNPTFVPPLQQHLELAKAEQGKQSPVIQKLTRSEHR
jgi:hypothetical protein